MKCIDLTHIKSSDSPLSTGSNSPHMKSTDPAFFRISYSPHYKSIRGTDSPLNEALDWDSRRAAAERLLQEAISSWREAREVLAEVKELQARQQRAEHSKTRTPTTPSQNRKKKSPWPNHSQNALCEPLQWMQGRRTIGGTFSVLFYLTVYCLYINCCSSDTSTLCLCTLKLLYFYLWLHFQGCSTSVGIDNVYYSWLKWFTIHSLFAKTAQVKKKTVLRWT